MRKKILLVSALCLAGPISAHAQKYTADCDSLNIMLMSMNDDLDINANWRSESSGSSKYKTVSVGDSSHSADPSFSISCPNFNANYDGKVLKIKADSYKGIIDHLYKQLNRGVDLYNYRWYTDPKLKTDFKVDKYSFDLDRLLLTDGYIKIPEGSSMGNDQSFIASTAAISYKINGGELKPLLLNKSVANYSSDFKASKTIDLYHKNPDIGRKGFGVERIFIDKENGVLEIYKQYVFPPK
ncbi:hypothetical protein [Psychrobacter sp.]|uniref:hypothetical protein n=1 Tax=Psychrobacter sp. TaxID=56811 RepID=UPI0025FC2ED2|nr:hypothetical protein [Psychrobacter sp.]